MADAALDPARDMLVLGVTRHSASAAVRDGLFAAEPDLEGLLARLHGTGVREAMVLSTCERVEFFAVTADPAAAAPGLVRALADAAGVAPEELADQAMRHQGAAALRHLFAVAASLDSQMVGEPQILGQVKECHRRAAAAGVAGPVLEAALQAAYAAAKRVRNETPVAQQPVSIAASALLVARDIHGDLGRRAALLLGLGEMGEFMATELKEAGVRDLVAMHASRARAEAAARRLGCHFRPWEELEEALAGADIVVSAVGAGGFTVTARQAEAALKRRRRDAIFFIDVAVPGDIDPAVNALDGAFVYDLADLEGVALRGKASREAAAAAAWTIVDEELAAFLRQRAERSAAPSVAALRRHFEAVRADVLSGGQLSAEEATRRLVNRLLHDPSQVLRAAAAEGTRAGGSGRAALEAALRRLFRIGEAGEAEGPRRGREEEDR
ncbi:MAG: glutamyl-tRNA reductase [Kiloniellaceae bacterium]